MKIRSCIKELAFLLPWGLLLNSSPASSSAASSAIDAFKNLDYRYFVAGGTCAAISHGITTPIDVVRFWMTFFMFRCHAAHIAIFLTCFLCIPRVDHDVTFDGCGLLIDYAR